MGVAWAGAGGREGVRASTRDDPSGADELREQGGGGRWGALESGGKCACNGERLLGEWLGPTQR
eukprot:6450216-Lingulodinium_polyedra.AAC.1